MPGAQESSTGASVEAADICALSHESGRFDRVVAEAVTMFVDRNRAIRRIGPRLSPGREDTRDDQWYRPPADDADDAEDLEVGPLPWLCPYLRPSGVKVTDHRISVRQLQELLAAGRPVTVVDVRSPTDVDWAIPGSINVDAYEALGGGHLGPLAELNLPPGPVVTVCGMGRTAAIATGMLRAHGVEALTLDGGMQAWSLAWNIAETEVASCDIVQVRRTGKGCLSYIVASQAEAVVIDASLDSDVYAELLAAHGLRLVAVVDTHIHADHLSRSRLLAQRGGVELWLPTQNRAHFPLRPISDGDMIPVGSARLVAMHTPGHTAESTTYLLDKAAAFTGDTLFVAGVGRPDLEGGGPERAATRARHLHESISRLLDLPATALILPGHVPEPIPFDGQLLAAHVGEIREKVPLTRLDRDAFVEAVVARIPPTPPNHLRIVELNERGELPDETSELEAGANRCAIA
jgi:glyoxylase-like metal-dependent hydrolase (beta-lactamase superfamily II)